MHHPFTGHYYAMLVVRNLFSGLLFNWLNEKKPSDDAGQSFAALVALVLLPEHSVAVLVALILILLPEQGFIVLKALILLPRFLFNFPNNEKDADTNASDSPIVSIETSFDAPNSSIAATLTHSNASSLLTANTGDHFKVFLSCRGSSSLEVFTNNLHDNLVNAGVCSIRDNGGEELDPDLMLNINSSKILIPILSMDDGSSARCLDKLIQRLARKDGNTGHIVLPIFYKGEPAQLRSFGDTFHTRDPMIEEKWKQSLIKISSLKGWEAEGDEEQLVELVVRKVLIELKKALEPIITENSTGIKGPMEEIIDLVDSHGSTLYVGIHGEDGTGKTTLAKVIYNKLSERFDHCSFIPNVTESCNCNGIEYLLHQLIWDIGDERKYAKDQLYDKDRLIAILSSRFKRHRVLIVLDDVNAKDQLKALAGEQERFATGSKIIVTTRDKDVFYGAKLDFDLELQAMKEDEAETLFARHAFGRNTPPAEFSCLSGKLVSTVRRFPLTLEIIGSYLCGKSKRSWEKTLEVLQDSKNSQELPTTEMQEILKLVYQALEFEQKKIFLDIACFLVGSDARIASCMWDTGDFNMEPGVEELIFSSLIKIGDNHELIMHNEVRDFGRSIAREGRCNEPDNGGRLWDYEEALQMLDGNGGTANTRALSLDRGNSRQTGGLGSPSQMTPYTNEQFENLVNLRFLRVSDANFERDFKVIFSKLRWLQWERCPDNLEAKNFAVEELAVLDLSRSMISDNWAGWKPIMSSAKKLKVLNLTGCDSLESTLFLSDFKHLEILILRNCKKLKNILPSIGDLETLVSLDLSGCSGLEELPGEVGNLEGLKELLLDQTLLREIPDKIWSLVKLQRLSLQSCSKLSLNRNSIVNLESLTELVLTGTDITELPESIRNLQNLEILNIRRTGLESLPNAIGNLGKLRKLDASWCEKLSKVARSIYDLLSLQSLDLRKCVELQELPKLPSNLTVVSVTCKSDELPSFSHLEHLKQLRLHYCKSLKFIPVLPPTALELEILGCDSLKSLTPPEADQDFRVSLTRLDIIDCRSLGKLELSRLYLLRVLYALDCKEIRKIGGLDRLDCLESLIIQGGTSIELGKPFSSLGK